MNAKVILALSLVWAPFTSPWNVHAEVQGRHLTVLYTADERGEIMPCG